MANPFRNTVVPVKRPPAGDYVDGVWVEGAPSNFDIKASVQPASGEDMESLPENRRTLATYRLYTDIHLLENLEGVRNPDVVTLFGEDYEVTKVFPWRNGIIDHYKILATRIQPS